MADDSPDWRTSTRHKYAAAVACMDDVLRKRGAGSRLPSKTLAQYDGKRFATGWRVHMAVPDAGLVEFLDRVGEQPLNGEDERRRSVQNRIVELLDSWSAVVGDYQDNNVAVGYQRGEWRQPHQPLLRGMLEKDFESDKHRLFRANRSLRDVEPEVGLWLRDLTGGEVA